MMDTTAKTIAAAGGMYEPTATPPVAARDGPGSSAHRSASPNSLLSWRSENAAAPQTPGRERLDQALGDLARRLRADATELTLRIDEATGVVQAEIVDSQSGRAIRRIPSGEALRLSEAIGKGSPATISDATA